MTTPNGEAPTGTAAAAAPGDQASTPIIPATTPAPPAVPPKEERPPAKVEPAKTEPQKTEASTKPAPVQIDAESEIPSDAELIQLSKPALRERLGRHTKKELREHFGTDDFGEIKSKLERLEQFEAAEEERRRADLSEKERLEEDLRKEREARERAESSYQRAVDSQAFAEYDANATKAITQYFDDSKEVVEYVTHHLKKHVLSLSDEETPKDPKASEKLFGEWAAEFAKKNPKLVKKAPEAPTPKEIALSNGASPHRPEKSPTQLANKTLRPGQPNSMSKSEYAQWKRQHGLA